MTTAREPRGLGFVTGGVGAMAVYALFALFALFAMAHYAFIGAFSAAVVWWWAKRKKWPGNWGYRKVWYAALWGLLAYFIPTWLIDLVFHTYHSLFGVMALIDQHACLANCDAPNPYNSIRIWDIASYYAFAAPGLLGWGRYILLQIPGVVAGVAGTMAMMQEQASHPGGTRRVLATALFFIGFEVVVGIPWFISSSSSSFTTNKGDGARKFLAVSHRTFWVSSGWSGRGCERRRLAFLVASPLKSAQPDFGLPRYSSISAKVFALLRGAE